MEVLHAPWRIKYILAPKPPRSDNSLFTQIGMSSDDETNLVIARSKHSFALLNRYPYNGGHTMTVPYKQVTDFNGLTDEEILDLMNLTKRCQNALAQLMKPDGFNIGVNIGRIAGAGIEEHLHIHIVPRWSGDTNFMPIIANTSVVPQALSELAKELRLILNK